VLKSKAKNTTYIRNHIVNFVKIGIMYAKWIKISENIDFWYVVIIIIIIIIIWSITAEAEVLNGMRLQSWHFYYMDTEC